MGRITAKAPLNPNSRFRLSALRLKKVINKMSTTRISRRKWLTAAIPVRCTVTKKYIELSIISEYAFACSARKKVAEKMIRTKNGTTENGIAKSVREIN